MARSDFFDEDNTALAFNGERGEAQYGSKVYGTSTFGYRKQDQSVVTLDGLNNDVRIGSIDRFYVWYDGHPGTDYAVPQGTNVLAAANGTVLEAEWSSNYGNYVKLQHPNGHTTLYGHFSNSTPLVSVGQNVVAGQHIGEVGSSGPPGVGIHLHFEVRQNDQFAVDPYGYLGSDVLWLGGGGIQPDRHEPNDSFGSATNVNSVGLNDLDNLSIDTGNDDDFFRYTPAANGGLEINALFSHAAGDIDLEVYDSGFNLIGSSTSVTNNEQVNVTVSGGSTYYIKVFGFQQETNPNYDLDIFGTGGGGGNDIDLTSGFFDVDPESNVQAGSTIDVQIEVDNLGTDSSGSFGVDVYLSTNSTITSSDEYLGTVQFSSVSGGGSSPRLDTPFTLPPASSSAWSNGDGEYWIGIEIDGNNNVDETDEGNNDDDDNIFVIGTGGGGGNDVDLVSGFFDVDPESNVQAGSTIDVQVEVDNLGSDASGSFDIDVYLSTNDNISNGDEYLGTIRASSVPGGGTSQRYDVPFTLPPANDPAYGNGNGEYWIGVQIDGSDEVDETDEGNNEDDDNIFVVGTGPGGGNIDLLSAFFDVDPESNVQAGSTIDVQFEIENPGTDASGSFDVGIYLSTNDNISDGDDLLGTVRVSSIPAGTTTSRFDLPFSLPPGGDNAYGNDDGEYWIGIQIDDNNEVNESDEDNNEDDDNIFIVGTGGGGGLPDLTLTDIQVDGDASPTRPFTVGEAVETVITTFNDSDVDVGGGIDIGYYITTAQNEALLTSANFIDDDLENLDPFEMDTESDVYTFESGDVGQRWFAARIDDPVAGGGDIDESDEDNNVIWWGPFTVEDPDLEPPQVVASAFTFETQQAIAFTFDEDVSASLDPGDLLVTNTTTGQSFTPFAASGGNPTATFAFAGLLSDGNYTATLPAASVTDAAGNAMTADATLDFFVLAGDANRDRRVNLSDFTILAGNFGRTGGALFSQADFNYDGNVNLSDFTILAGRFGVTLPPPGGSGGDGGLFGDGGDDDR